MAFRPYLNFPGTCREAFTRYQEIFGGELFIMGAEDTPEGEMPPDWKPDLVVHAALRLRDGVLMASDDPSMDGPPSGTYVHYEAEGVDDATRVFEALSDGGRVEMPMDATFWSPAFGVCADRWGTLWMVGAPDPDQAGTGQA